jgi:hypothetical protein
VNDAGDETSTRDAAPGEIMPVTTDQLRALTASPA